MHAIEKNPLRTRSDVERLLLDLMKPLEGRFTEGDAGLHLGDFGVHYGEGSARMEAFSRLLWGLAPYWHGGGTAYLDVFRRGLVNGTDPHHSAYWGTVVDYDQKIVEMAAISLTLILCGEQLALTEREGRNLHAWLNQVNGRDIPKNNWFFFRVLVNAAFRRMGWAWDEEETERDLRFLDGCYLGGGWYCDGPDSQMDYYIPFGMHFYGLVYAVAMADLDPERCRLYRARAAEFAPDFLLWFEDGGRAVPFGRSLTYRFGQCAFFSAAAFAGVDSLPWGVVKSRVLGNLRDWFAQPILQGDGILSVGYGYPNLLMSENYNGHGSPYWAFKALLVLALPESHPFWRAEEEIPALPAQKMIFQARMLAVRGLGQVQLFPAGQMCVNQLGHCAAKYEKLCYSSKFGFSVPRGNTLEEGAFDGCLAVSEAGEEHYRMQRGFTSYTLTEEGFTRVFRPMAGVEVRVEVTPHFPGHTRRYTITTDRPIDVADGGFAIAAEVDGVAYDVGMVERDANSVVCRFPWGLSSIICEEGDGEPVLVKAFPNTNLLHPLTRIPTIRFRLGAGVHHLTTTVLGQ